MLTKSEELQVDFLTRWKFAQEEAQRLETLWKETLKDYKEKKLQYESCEDHYQRLVAGQEVSKAQQWATCREAAKHYAEYQKAVIAMEQLRILIEFWKDPKNSGFIYGDPELDYGVYGIDKPMPAFG